MALPKLFQRIFWHNNATPAINEDNLNAMSKGLSDVDDRLIDLAGTIMEDVPQIQEDIEELEELAEDLDTAVQTAQNAATSAQSSASNANAKALVSEGWAKGTQNGTAVGSSSPYYHNNAEYFKNQARSFTPEGYQDLVDDVDSVKEALTNQINVNGSKNILINSVYSGQTSRGITATVSDEGVMSISGTNTSSSNNAMFELYLGDDLILETGEYTFYWGINTGSFTSYWFNIHDYTASTDENLTYTTNKTVTLTKGHRYRVALFIYKSYAISGTLSISPMICLKSDYQLDPTYAPPVKTNRQLTEDSVSWSDEAQIGAVNELNNTATTQIVESEVTFTVNDDKSVTASWSSITAQRELVLCGAFTLTNTRRLSGCPSGGGNTTHRLYAVDSSNHYYSDDGNGIILPSGSYKSVRMVIFTGASSPLTFKPMIAPVSYNGPYVPYAKTNKELTDDASSLLQTLKNGDLLSFLKIRDVVMNTYWTDNATPSDYTQLTNTQVTDMVQAMLDTFKKLGGAKDTVYFGRLRRRNLKANGDVLSEGIYTPFLVASRETYNEMLSQTTAQGTNVGVITIAYLNIGSSSITLISKWGNDIRYEVVGNSPMSKLYQNWTRITTYKG